MTSLRSKKQLDKIDEAILNELSDDARIPFAELARKVGLSRNALRNRVAKLEADKVISKYTIERGDGKENSEKTIGLIMIDRRDRMRGADVTLALKNIPEVKTCYVMSGKFDLIVQVEVEEAVRLKEICSQIWELPGVQDTRTNFVLSTIVDRR